MREVLTLVLEKDEQRGGMGLTAMDGEWVLSDVRYLATVLLPQIIAEYEDNTPVKIDFGDRVTNTVDDNKPGS